MVRISKQQERRHISPRKRRCRVMTERTTQQRVSRSSVKAKVVVPDALLTTVFVPAKYF